MENRIFGAFRALVLGLIVSSLASLAPSLFGDGQVFRDTTDVVVTDVMIELKEGRSQRWRPDWVARSRWDATSFQVLLDGQSLPVLAVDPPNTETPEPWRLVLYFDSLFADQRTIHLAARDLSSRVEELIALGSVEIVLADPMPGRLLPATRDLEEISAVLSQLAIEPQGENALIDWRGEWLSAHESALVEEKGSELVSIAAQAAAEEYILLRRQNDALLRFLIQDLDAGSLQTGARRSLLLISEGFDLDPTEFYCPILKTALPEDQVLGFKCEALLPEGDPRDDFQWFSQTLAAFGWITFPISPPRDIPDLENGIGKLALLPPKAEYREIAPDPFRPDDTIAQVVFNPVRFKIKEHRDPEKAEAYLVLAETRLASGDLEGTREALEKSIYHFADDRKTAERQAVATRKLGELQRRLGSEHHARRAFEQAEALDERSVEIPFARLHQPLEPLGQIAEITSGAIVRNLAALDAALSSLQQRVRLTFQLPIAFDGKIHDLEVSCQRRGCQTRAPRQARSSTPDTIAAMRLRQALESETPPEGDLEIQAELLNEDQLEITLTKLGLEHQELDTVRISLAWVDDSEQFILEHHRVGSPDRAAGKTFWRHEVSWNLSTASMVVVLVEDLISGRFGLTVADF